MSDITKLVFFSFAWTLSAWNVSRMWRSEITIQVALHALAACLAAAAGALLAGCSASLAHPVTQADCASLCSARPPALPDDTTPTSVMVLPHGECSCD